MKMYLCFIAFMVTCMSMVYGLAWPTSGEVESAVFPSMANS